MLCDIYKVQTCKLKCWKSIVRRLKPFIFLGLKHDFNHIKGTHVEMCILWSYSFWIAFWFEFNVICFSAVHSTFCSGLVFHFVEHFLEEIPLRFKEVCLLWFQDYSFASQTSCVLFLAFAVFQTMASSGSSHRDEKESVGGFRMVFNSTLKAFLRLHCSEIS